MNSLPERRRLLALQQWRQQRAERVLHQSQRQLQALRAELAGFAGQEASLQQLLASHRATDCVLERVQLLALLRTQAVIRRQLDLLRVEHDHVAGQCRALEQSLQVQREHLREARRRHDTCARSVQQGMRAQRQEQLRREEREMDDMSGVRR
ncbi:type III secretion protein [Pseudomonas sp. MYb118]|uniref:type III secretion protein n=1 Tax=Pseudomonas sp. MYb118 TaxID=1848720 RepID=UPI0034CEBF74